MRRFEAAYVKYIKSFFGFECRYSVTEMFCDLGLLTFNTVFKFGSFSVLYVVCFLVCLSVFCAPFCTSLLLLYRSCCVK